MRKIFTRRGRSDIYLCDDFNEFNTFYLYMGYCRDVPKFGFINLPISNGEIIKFICSIGDGSNPHHVGKMYPDRRVIEVYHGTVFENFLNRYDRSTAEDLISTHLRGSKASDSADTG